jgi:hypothetical protein
MQGRDRRSASGRNLADRQFFRHADFRLTSS